MQEKFYCVGCKSHYELDPTGLERKPSKGGSFRYAIKSVCPEGHRTSKICNSDDFADHADDLELCPKCGSESCSDCRQTILVPLVPDDPDYDDYEAEGMTVGVNLEALAPTPDEPESGESLVPADSLLPEGSGRTIGSQSVSHNYTPFHAEDAEEYCDEYCEENGGHCASCCEHPSCEISNICVLHCDGDYHSGPCMIAEGQKFPCDSCNQMVSRSDLKVMSGSYDEDYQICRECLTYEAEQSEEMVGVCDYCSFVQSYAPSNMLLIADNPELAHDYCKACNSNHPDYEPTDECEDFKPRNPDVYEGNIWFCQGCGSGTDMEVPLSETEKYMDAETFIAYPELKDHLVAVMPDKVYGVKDLGDGDFEMKVSDRYMDDVIEAVSDYQTDGSETTDQPSFFLGQSKSTVAAVAAVVALGLAFWQNRKG